MATSPIKPTVPRLPYPFNKERPFETAPSRVTQSRHTECAKESTTAENMEPASTVKIFGENKGREDSASFKVDMKLEGLDTQQFARHEIALEKIQINMRKFLREHAEAIDQQGRKASQLPSKKRTLDLLKVTFQARKENILHQLFLCSFFHDLCLARIARTETSDQTDPLYKLKDSILKAQEVIYNFESCLLSNQESSVVIENEIIMWNNYFEEKSSLVSSVLEETKFCENCFSEDDIARYRDRNSRICYALGLRSDFLDKLDAVVKEYKFHISLEEWIITFLTDIFKEVSNKDEPTREFLTADLLVGIGFREDSRAITTLLSRAQKMQHHVDPIESVQRYIVGEFRYNPVLSVPARFPYSQHNPNVIIQLENPKLEIMNVSVTEDIDGNPIVPAKTFITEYLSELAEEITRVLLFHGTDHHCALDIIHRGIDIDLGHQRRDFSSGFYLTDDYDRCETWSFSQTRKPAVLVFYVSKDALANAKRFTLAGNEWLDVVTSFRRGEATKALRHTLREYDLLEGPVASLEISEMSPDEGRSVVIEEIVDSYQCCVTSDDLADDIRSFLITAVFFDSSGGYISPTISNF